MMVMAIVVVMMRVTAVNNVIDIFHGNKPCEAE